MRKETVLLISDYSMEYVGGAQSALRRQANALVAEGVGCILLAPGAAAPDSALDSRVHRQSPPVRAVIPVLGLPVLGDGDDLEELVARLIRKRSVIGIVIHSEFALAAAAIRAATRASIPVLHTVHTFFWRAPAALSMFAPLLTSVHARVTRLPRAAAYRGASPIVNALRSMTLRTALQADAVLSPSHHQADALRTAGVRDVRTLSNVVLPAAVTSPPATEPLILLWAARFAPEKRLRVALHAIRIVRERLGPGRVHLHVAGGTHRPGRDITFHGKVSTERVDELIRNAHAIVITSLGFDNQPMVALEAFARGRPAIVSDPVLAEEFGQSAIATPTPDARGLASAIIELIIDPSRLHEAGTEAESYAVERAPSAHVEQVMRHFRLALTTM